MTFGRAEAVALFGAVESHAKKLGLFDRVNTHEPVNAPGRGLSCSIVIDPDGLRPEPMASGLNATSGRVTFLLRIYSSMLSKPLDGIDPEVLGAAAQLLAEYNGAFTLGGTVRNVDVMTATARPLYLEQDGKEFRVMQVTLPCVISDMFPQGA